MAPAEPAEVSDDGFLGGRIKLLQPRRGYRAGSDAMLLAAAVPARAGETVLDAGAGVGAVALALARRVEGGAVDALELQPDLAELARENVRRNELTDRVRVLAGNLAAPPGAVAGRRYDHVVSNPPYHDAASGRPAPDPGRALARSESDLGLEAWLGHCLKRLAPGGTLTLVQRAGRLAQVLSALSPATGGIVVFPLWPAPGRPAERILVHAVKASRAPLMLAAGLLLHRPDGGYTEAAEAVLRQGAALPLRAEAT